MTEEKQQIKCLDIPSLRETLLSMGEKPFHAGQIFKWLHQGVCSFDEMTDLSKALRAKLQAQFLLTVPQVARRQVSQVDGTVKYLWRLTDGESVESVFMRYEHGNTACVSTQVGCRMGCKFCASGLNGLKRNLTAGEILDQVLFMQRDMGEKISHIVLMGTGEPLDNYENVLSFLHLVSAEGGLHVGKRHISLSTSGIADKIELLAGEHLQLTLSISLHAPDDESRSRMMPVNKRYPVSRLMEACRYYFDETGRRISYEYALADGVSDRPWQAEMLAKLLHGRPAHVNLIPLNRVEESVLKPSSREAVRRFQTLLEQRGVTATVRRRLGPDIDASCGQLRRRVLKEGEDLQ